MKLETRYLWALNFLSNDPFSFCLWFWRLQMSSPILPGRESLWQCLPFLPVTQCSPNWLQSSGQPLASLQSAMLKYSYWLLVKWNSVVLSELMCIATWEVNTQVQHPEAVLENVEYTSELSEVPGAGWLWTESEEKMMRWTSQNYVLRLLDVLHNEHEVFSTSCLTSQICCCYTSLPPKLDKTFP